MPENPLDTKHPLSRLVSALAIAIEAKISAVMLGNPGWAKTDLVEAIAKKLRYDFFKYEVPGTIDPTQFEGLPGFAGEGDDRHVVHLPYKWLIDMAKAKRAVLFIDDLAEANLEIQGRFLKVLHGRKIGDRIYPNTSFVAAANPEGGELQISDALHNRILLIPWVFPCQDVGEAFINNFPVPEIPEFDPNWEKKYLRLRLQQIGAYIMTLDDMLKVEGEAAMTTRGPHQSPRSLKFVAQLLAAYDGATMGGQKLDDGDLELLLLKGCIGEIAASNYIAWLDIKNKPTPQQILANHEALVDCGAMKDDGLSLLYTLVGIVGRHIIRSADADSWKQGCRLIEYLANSGKKSVGVNLAITLHEQRPEGVKDDPKEFAAYSGVFAVAGTV